MTSEVNTRHAEIAGVVAGTLTKLAFGIGVVWILLTMASDIRELKCKLNQTAVCVSVLGR